MLCHFQNQIIIQKNVDNIIFNGIFNQEWYIIINFNRKHNLTIKTIYTSFCFIFIG